MFSHRLSHVFGKRKDQGRRWEWPARSGATLDPCDYASNVGLFTEKNKIEISVDGWKRWSCDRTNLSR
jgi:hypothetical protein